MIVEEMEKNPILDSIWIGKNSAPNCSVYHSYKVCSDDIEYVRKDVARKEVIEKAVNWLQHNIDSSMWLKEFREMLEDSV